MKAMILAAGLGTRLRPLTDDRPKALVTVAGHTLLEIVLARLRSFGVREVIVNVHHFADEVVDYLQAQANFGMRIEISREETLLDTGGGLKQAAWFFLEAGSNHPFILHNVDVISTIDLSRMVQFHHEQNALAALAVQARESSRMLRFNETAQLCGRRVMHSTDDSQTEWAHPLEHGQAQVQALAFSGIHVLSPRIFAELNEPGPFSIINAYLRLAAQGERILAFHADQAYWRDLGRPESISAAARDLKDGKFSIERDEPEANLRMKMSS
jgi:NDP-sugar pyrophosphorylase family protein